MTTTHGAPHLGVCIIRGDTATGHPGGASVSDIIPGSTYHGAAHGGDPRGAGAGHPAGAGVARAGHGEVPVGAGVPAGAGADPHGAHRCHLPRMAEDGQATAPVPHVLTVLRPEPLSDVIQVIPAELRQAVRATWAVRRMAAVSAVRATQA